MTWTFQTLFPIWRTSRARYRIHFDMIAYYPFNIFICLYLLGHGGPLCSRYKKSLLLFSGYGNPFMVQDMEILALIETLSLFRIWKSLFVSFWDMEIPSSFRILKSSCLSGYRNPALLKRLDTEILCVLRNIICIWNPYICDAYGNPFTVTLVA